MAEESELRIGVYVCHCGRNIADRVRVKDVVEFARSLDGVVVARDYKYMCSDPGQDLIVRDIKEYKLNRVVVAACSPSLHERTFRNACKRGGLNPFLFYMANIRELDAWVTEDVEKATEKAKRFIRAIVNRVKLQKELEVGKAKINPNVLIVGGGIAGISAALTLADAGVHVYLVEKSPSIGGNMAKFDKTFPTLDCSACILTPKMTSVKAHPNITLLTYSEVESVEGYVGNFHVRVKRKPRYVREELCTGCYDCVENCLFTEPVFPSEFDEGIGKRKPVHIPFPQAVPLVPTIDGSMCMWLSARKCPKYCVEVCEPKAVDFSMGEEVVEFDVGAIIVATGYKPFDPSRIPQYGYGIYDNVYTSLQVERLLSSTGPTGGEVILRDGRKPERVAIIHCVGSRDENYNRYCSKVCCMYSIKLAHLIRERTGADVFNFYIDIRAAGKAYEEFYRRVLSEGVYFVRGRVAYVTDIPESEEEEKEIERGRVIVVVEDTLLGRVRRIPVDMVVLSVGLEPSDGADQIRQVLKLSCSADGWFAERHPKLAPVATNTEGIFIAGCAQGPKDIPETVAQAQAAAGEALSLIQRGEIELEPSVSYINKEKCSGCGVCVPLCPFNAISMVLDEEGRQRAEVNPALCQGCGTCVAACPSRALDQHLFSREEVLAEIIGLVKD